MADERSSATAASAAPQAAARQPAASAASEDLYASLRRLAGVGYQLRAGTRAHQLHAATRAADHYLDQDGPEDHSTGSWLVACALGQAEKLAGEAEDLASAMKRGSSDTTAAAAEGTGTSRRPTAPTAPLRGVTVQ